MHTTNPALIQFPLRRDSWHASFMTRTFFGNRHQPGNDYVCSFSSWCISVRPLLGSVLIAFPIIGIWGWRRYSIGTVELSDHDLVVRSRTHTQTYPWEDIASVTATTLEDAKAAGPDGWILRNMGLDMKRPVALLGLRRQYREPVIWQRSGTRTLGIPRGNKVLIELEDVRGFVELANEYLRVARP